MGHDPDLNGFPTGALAIECLAEIHRQTVPDIFALACRTLTVTPYMTRLQILIQFVDEVSHAARTTHNPHTIVARGIAGKKTLVLNRLVEPYGNRFSMNNGWRNNTIWMRLSGAEPEVSREERETAVRRAALQTRHIMK